MQGEIKIAKAMEDMEKEKKHKCDGGDDYGLVDCKGCEKQMLSHLNPMPTPQEKLIEEFEKAPIRHLSINEGTELDGIVWVAKEDVLPFFTSAYSKGIKQGWIDGFASSGEGYNGEYLQGVGNGPTDKDIEKVYEENH